MAFTKINTRFLQRPPDGTKPWWFQNGRVDIFLWTLADGSLRMVQCATQETSTGVEAYADWRPGKGVRVGTVQGRPVMSQASPTVDFAKIPSDRNLSILLNRTEECLDSIPATFRGNVVLAIAEMSSHFIKIRNER